MENDFLDWKWQFANRITTAKELKKYLPLGFEEYKEIEECLNHFSMAITPYYLSLIDKNNPFDPIKAQAVPSIKETYIDKYDMKDPLKEDDYMVVPNLVHRYPDRVLFLVTWQCSMYCRHCTRRRKVGEEDRVIDNATVARAVEYIEKHTEIRDVLISGGDPFTMGTTRLEHIISQVRAIKHVEVIRIGTRTPVVMPMRIDDELVNMLKKYQPIWINTHFNHPNEITPLSKAACEKIVDAGIPLGNQSVLLKGVNDDAEIMKKLNTMLVQIRVRPYYLYQCDLSMGISHFRTSVEKGISIMHALQGNISGFAIPRYIIDTPYGGGKIPMQYEYYKGEDENFIYLENFEGKRINYPKIKE